MGLCQNLDLKTGLSGSEKAAESGCGERLGVLTINIYYSADSYKPLNSA